MLKIKFVFIYLGLILLSTVALVNCSGDNIITPAPVDSSDFRYPFKDGSRWNYTITLSASDIQPDSILYYFNNYPLVTNGTATILYDTMINSVVTKCFLDEFTFNGTLRKNRFYYINNDTSLILFARRQQGPPTGILPLKKIKNILSDPGNDYSNNVYKNELEFLGDSLYSTLKYPMSSGTEWSYIINGNTTTKKYSGFENVIVPAGTISCMKEIVTYSYSPTGIYYNYYSKFGLMKTYFLLNNFSVSTPTNPDGIGTVDLTQEVVVTSFNIPSD